jgi:DNA-binding beta-propeller fold protein YncE
MHTVKTSGHRALVAAVLVIGTVAIFPLLSPLAQGTIPVLEVDPFWPKMPEKFIFGPVRGVAVDSQDHVWIAQDGSGLSADMRGAAANPPQAECCMPAPPIVEFDANGNYIKGWGGPGEGYDWPQQIHGLFIDNKGNLWVSSERAGDHHILKFSRDGKFLLQIGKPGQSTGNSDKVNVNRAADMHVHPRTNELFVADGYGNRRVVVFDADTGAYKRHWGAYGNPPEDPAGGARAGATEAAAAPAGGGRGGRGGGRGEAAAAPAPARGANAQPSPQFNLVHDVRVSNDDIVYVADRNNNRIQIFSLDGKFIREVFIARDTSTSNGTVYSLAFSVDAAQRFLYVADAGNGRVRILNRQTMEVLGSIGRWGRQPGQFMVPHDIAVDSKGNLYVGEIREGNIQKFVLKSALGR